MGICGSTQFSVHVNSGRKKFHFLCIADMDQASSQYGKENEFSSFIQYGTLYQRGEEFQVEWENREEVTSDIADSKGRGMELSDAIIVDGECLTFDDRTAKCLSRKMFGFNPNDTTTFKPSEVSLPKMKIEWCFQKNSKLYYGSHLDIHRKKTCTVAELDVATTALTDICDMSEFVKQLGQKIAADPDVPTYSSITVEAASYSASRGEMLIVPRALMYTKFDPKTDTGAHGWNKFLKVKWDSHASLQALNEIQPSDIEIVTLTTPQVLEKGFAAIDWVPANEDGSPETVLAAVKSVETNFDGVETVESYFSVFDLEGRVLLEDVRFPGKMKYEGLAFYDPLEAKPMMGGGSIPSSPVKNLMGRIVH